MFIYAYIFFIKTKDRWNMIFVWFYVNDLIYDATILFDSLHVFI